MAYDTATEKKKLSKKDEAEILEKLEEYFQQAIEDQGWRDARADMVKCFDYKENRQWTSAELAEMAKRGQPPTVNNQVAVTIDRIVGQFVQIKSKTTYKPRNQPFDVGQANVESDIYTYIRQRSGLEFEERDTLEDGATGGFGVLEVCIDDDDPMDKDVRVKHEDCFNVLPDPKSKRYDWNDDARFLIRYKWVDVDYLKELYPKKKAQISSLMTSNIGTVDLADVDTLQSESYVDYKRHRVRLVEVQYKKRVPATRYIFSDGKVFDEDEVENGGYIEKAKEAGIDYTTDENTREQICIGVFTEGILFEHGISKRRRFSLVPFFVSRKKSGAPYGPITRALSIQDAINKRESKALAMLTLNQTVAEVGAIKDKTDWQQQNAKADGFMEVNEGFFEKVKIDKNLELAQSQHAMHMASKQDFRQVTGVNPDALGEKSEIRSGVGIQRKVAQTGLIIAPIFDNFKRTREVLAKTIMDAVRFTYTPGKVMTITDNPESAKMITLTDDDITKIRDFNYDVIISEDQDWDTNDEAVLETLGRTLPSILPYGQGWAEVMFELSHIRDKEKILEKVKKISAENAPGNMPKMSVTATLDTLSLPEKIFFYQQMKAPPEILQAIQQASPPPTQVLKSQEGAQKAQIDMQKSQVEHQNDMHMAQLDAQAKQQETQQKLTVTQAKTDADVTKAGIDIQMAQIDLQLKQLELQKAMIEASQPKEERSGSQGSKD